MKTNGKTSRGKKKHTTATLLQNAFVQDKAITELKLAAVRYGGHPFRFKLESLVLKYCSISLFLHNLEPEVFLLKILSKTKYCQYELFYSILPTTESQINMNI